MRRILPLVLLLLLPCTAQAQPVPDWVARWMSDQRAAHRGVVSVMITEHSQVRFERADGTRNVKMESELDFGREPALVDRRIVEMNGRRMERPSPGERSEPDRGQRRDDAAWISDRLVRPLFVVEGMRASGEPEQTELDGKPAIRLSMTARDEEFQIRRITAWFDRNSAALLMIKAFVGSTSGTALNVEVRYARFEGLDLPVGRRSEGSFTDVRRERGFSTLVDVTADYDPPRIERG